MRVILKGCSIHNKTVDDLLGGCGIWNIVLATSSGFFENKVGHIFSQDDIKGKKFITVYRWDLRDASHPVWSQATSPDNGKNWEWNWYMYFTKA